ncbi:hypothetical protein Patl1_13990 [Pistacia atlantica]|uniref:Uncharacterized protein n=1 Tax=Pistacia atlantica TaxID=434234 RepID=A0ACC1AXK1_9ROSI|nr:hypothetical protein Patl1_13990 [Pistacia atlantica]
MDSLLYLYLLVLIPIVFIIYQLLTSQNKIELENQLPSPPALPIIGHFHLLKLPLYKTLNNLSSNYGPIFLLRLGLRPTLVLSSCSVIQECFTKNDIIFANRPLLPSRKISTYNFTTLGGQYGNHWRNLRRFSALEIFSANRLQMSSNVRAEELRFVVKYLFKSSFKGAPKVDVKAFLYMLDFNIMMKMIVGERWFHFEEEEMDMDMSKAKLDEFMKMFSPPMMAALGDYLPFLRWLTYFGVEKKMLKVHRKRDAFLQTLLDAYRNPNDQSTSVPNSEINQTILDVMLKLQESEPEFYTDDVIKGIMQVFPTTL